jgi:DNA-binding transcriptional LysR family regulator
MKTTLSQIEAFCWIARLRSFQAAASRLNLSQPTISLRIQGLERALGRRLFERAGRRVELTIEGAALLPEAERMMALSEHFSAKAPRRDPLRGRLRLGAPDSFALVCMPGLLGKLRKVFPELDVALTIDNSSVLGQKLNKRELDVALLAAPDLEPHVAAEPLGPIPLAWMASPALRLRRSLGPGDLVRYPVFTNPEPSNLMTLVRGWFSAAGLEPPRLSTCNSLSVILRLTVAGEGVSLLPTAMLGSEIGSGTLRILKTRPSIVEPRLFFAYQTDKAGRSIDVVSEMAQQVIANANFLAGPGSVIKRRTRN